MFNNNYYITKGYRILWCILYLCILYFNYILCLYNTCYTYYCPL